MSAQPEKSTTMRKQEKILKLIDDWLTVFGFWHSAYMFHFKAPAENPPRFFTGFEPTTWVCVAE